MSYKFSNNEKKIFLLLSLLVALIDIAFVSMNYVLTRDALFEEFKDQRNNYEQALNAQVNSTTDNLVLVASLFANKPEVQELFYRGKLAVEKEGGGKGGPQAETIRRQLYEMVSPEWNQSIQEQNTRQLHFHLGPGSLSFLRVHKPNKFGDRMDDIRHVIVATNNDQKIHAGFETGRVYSGLRGVVPVWYRDAENRNHYVGALEAGASFLNPIESIDKHFGVGVAVLLLNDHLRSTVWPEFADKRLAESISDCDCVEEASSRSSMRANIDEVILQTGPLLNAKEVRLVQKKDQYFTLSVSPVRDFLGQENAERDNVGLAVFWRNVSVRMHQYKNDQNSNFIFGLFSYLAIELLIFVFIRKITAYLQMQITQATGHLQAALQDKNKANRRLAETFDRQKQLFAIIGHELRTPAASMKMAIDDLDGEKLGEHEQILKDTSEHLLSVLDDMRYVARPERSHQSKSSAGQVYKVIENVIHSVNFLFREKNIQVHLEADELSHRFCHFRVQLFRQIVTNIIKNAAKHSGASDLWIRVKGQQLDNNIEYHVVFDDNGKGINRNDQEKLFSAFYQGSTSASGSGIGLHVSKTLANSLNGDLEYSDRPEGGARFTLSMNLPLEHQELAADQQHKEKAEDYLNRTFQGKNILFAEDTEFLRLMTEKALEKHGAVVTSKANGDLALQAAQQQDFDVVLTDIMMPGLNGYELSRKLRSMGYVNPIIGITGAMVGDESSRLIAAGADGVIAKPIDLIAVCDIIQHRQSRLADYLDPGPDPDRDPDRDDVDDPAMVLDFNQVSYALSDNEDQVKHALDAFVSNISRQLQDVNVAADNLDYEKIGFVAHKIKGTAASLYAVKMSRIAAALEHYCRQRNIKTIRKTILELEQAFTAVKQEILNKYL